MCLRHMGREVGVRTETGSGAALNNSLLTAADVAEMLGVPTTWVYEQSRRGRIPTVTLGRYRRYRAEAIAEWVEQQEADVAKGAVAGGQRGAATRIGVR